MQKSIAEIKTHIIAKLDDWLGTYTYGATVIPAILVLPDPEYGGYDAPERINGYPVVTEGIEIIIDTENELKFTPLLDFDMLPEDVCAILIKDWSGDRARQAVKRIAPGLDIIDQPTLPKDDKGAIVSVAILRVRYRDGS